MFKRMACHLCWTCCSSLMLENDNLEDVNTGNPPYPSTSQMLWFHRPCHRTPNEKLYLHGSQQQIIGLSLYENLVHVR